MVYTTSENYVAETATFEAGIMAALFDSARSVGFLEPEDPPTEYTMFGRTYPTWVDSDYERHLWDQDPYNITKGQS